MSKHVSLQQSIALLKKLVSINTGSYNQAGIESCIDLLIDTFAIFSCNYEKKWVQTNDNQQRCAAICFNKHPDAPKQCLLSIHLDTVFDQDSPFQTFDLIDDNHATGPGVIDAKGGIVILYNTLLQLEQSAIAGNIGWTVIISTDEEIGTIYSKPLLEQLAPLHDLALVFEPALTNGDIINQRPASANIAITAYGKSAHAGRGAFDGVNAIVPLVHFLEQLQQMTDLHTAEHTINIGTIKGGERENIIPDVAQAILNARFMDQKKLEDFIDQLDQLAHQLTSADQQSIKVETLSLRPAKPNSPIAKQCHQLLLDCAQSLQMPITIQSSFGVSDANFIAACNLPVIDTLGAIGSGMHTVEETIYLPSLVDRSELVFEFLKAYLNQA